MSYIDLREVGEVRRKEILDCAERIPRDWDFRRRGPVRVIVRKSLADFDWSIDHSTPVTMTLDTVSFDVRRLSRLPHEGSRMCLVADGHIVVSHREPTDRGR